MHSRRKAYLTLAALLVLCFGLAAWLQVWFEEWTGARGQSVDLLTVLMGDSRRIFANHFFVKADEYFHSGFYPSVFDKREAFQTPHMAEDSGTVAGKNQGDELTFLGKPRDWIDAFSRQFFPSRHTHLDEGGAQGQGENLRDLGESSEVGEILPWLRLSAELDPNQVQTYTVAAYWLRERMGKAAEAEQFLREALRANPGSYEILYELGRVYYESKKDPDRARNLWEAAIRSWQKKEAPKPEPDKFLLNEILAHLATLEKDQGNYSRALACMEAWAKVSPHPELVEKQAEEVRQKLNDSEPRQAIEPPATEPKSDH